MLGVELDRLHEQVDHVFRREPAKRGIAAHRRTSVGKRQTQTVASVLAATGATAGAAACSTSHNLIQTGRKPSIGRRNNPPAHGVKSRISPGATHAFG